MQNSNFKFNEKFENAPQFRNLINLNIANFKRISLLYITKN